MINFNYLKIENPTKKDRLPGLDILRALSVILGLLWHFLQIENGTPGLNLVLSTGPWGGANPLFLISGYLLGNQILSRYAINKKVSLFKFYFRRALKTWPSYFAIVLIVFSFPFFQSTTNTLPPFWKFLLFVQNFDLSNSVLSHTWSLCIEEHFYLVLPVVSLLFLLKPRARTVFTVVSLLLVAGLLIRGFSWQFQLNHTQEFKFRDYFNKIYYQTYTRLDGIILGVFLAYIQSFLPSLWKKLLAQQSHFLKLGLILCFFGYFLQVHRTDFVPTVFVFSIMAFGFGSIMLSALSGDSLINRFKFKSASTIATLSYTLYLVHRPAFELVVALLKGYQLSLGMELFLSVSLGFIFSFCFAYLLYLIVEKPFLLFRDRTLPSITKQS